VDLSGAGRFSGQNPATQSADEAEDARGEQEELIAPERCEASEQHRGERSSEEGGAVAKAQCLGSELGRDKLTDVVKTVCGIQAQDPRAAALSIRPRARTLDAEALASELHDEVVRTWSMRGTLHLIATEDLP